MRTEIQLLSADGKQGWTIRAAERRSGWATAAGGSNAWQVIHDGVDAYNPSATPDGRWIV